MVTLNSSGDRTLHEPYSRFHGSAEAHDMILAALGSIAASLSMCDMRMLHDAFAAHESA